MGRDNPVDLRIQCEFFGELYKLLVQVLAFTTPREQLEYLNEVFLWSFSSRNIKTSVTKTVNPDRSREIQGKLLPSEFSSREITQYSTGARTWHKDIDPSNDRLKNYQYRKIVSNLSTAATTQ
jgi:hypothetical protein